MPLIKGAHRHEKAKQRETELAALYEVGKVINSSFELSKTIDIIGRNASILLKVPKVLIFLTSDASISSLEIKKSIGFSEIQLEQVNKSDNFKQCTQILTSDVSPKLYKTRESMPYQEKNF